MLSQYQAGVSLAYHFLISCCKSDSSTSDGSRNCLFNIAFLILIVLVVVTITAPDVLKVWETYDPI